MQTAVSPINLMYNIHTKLCYIQVLLLGETSVRLISVRSQMADVQNSYTSLLIDQDFESVIIDSYWVYLSSLNILSCLESLPSASNTPEAAAASFLPEDVPALLLTLPETCTGHLEL